MQNPFCKQTGPGRPKFCDLLLQAGLCLRAVYGLSLRALQGFMSDLCKLIGIDCPTPHYTLFSKRMKELELPKLSRKRPSHILIDATGIKIFGEGEWKVKVHGVGKKRTWIKLHVSVDAKSQQVMAFKATSSSVGDSCVLPELIDANKDSVKKVSADGAYDGKPCRNYLYTLGIQDLIPPPSNARYRREASMNNRNSMLGLIQAFGNDGPARKLVKKLLGYNRRSLVETAFSRLKGMFGERFCSRKLENVSVEAHLKFWIMNAMIA